MISLRLSYSIIGLILKISNIEIVLPDSVSPFFGRLSINVLELNAKISGRLNNVITKINIQIFDLVLHLGEGIVGSVF